MAVNNGGGGGIAAWHLAVVLIDFSKIGKTRGAVMQELHEQNIGTQLHYLPIYRHRFFSENLSEPIMLSGAETYARRALSVPIFYGMNRDDVARVVNALKQTCQHMIGLIIQARYGSSRLRGKILLPLNIKGAEFTALDYVAQNALRVKGIDVVCFAVADDECKRCGCRTFAKKLSHYCGDAWRPA